MNLQCIIIDTFVREDNPLSSRVSHSTTSPSSALVIEYMLSTLSSTLYLLDVPKRWSLMYQDTNIGKLWDDGIVVEMAKHLRHPEFPS